MSASLKKLLLISITLLLGVMSIGVKAQTNYDFTQTFNFYLGGSKTFSGVFQTNSGSGDQAILGWSSLTFGPDPNPLLNPAAAYVVSNVNYYPLGGYNAQTNVFSSSDPSFPNYVLFNSAFSNGHGNNSWALSPQLNSLGPCDNSNCTGVYGGYESAGAAIITVSGGIAPEMNASLIPQVGLLLGCLFFLFGRKKEVVEPMLTA